MAEVKTVAGTPDSALIAAAALAKIVKNPDVFVLDGSYGLPPAEGRIPGTIDFDIDEVADPDAPMAHTLPSPDIFAAWCTAQGIGNDDHVIVYDRMGMAMAAARVWWMFRVFGHERVQVLDGGLPAWQNAGLPLEEDGETPARQKKAPFKANFRPELFKKRDDILANVTKKSFTVADARDGARYRGEAAEPRPGMGSGHIPGAVSVPYASLLDPATGLFKRGPALNDALKPIDASKPVAVSCGSGVTACVIALGLHLTGKPDAAIYGGSWAEWGGDPSLPKVKGAAP